MPKVRISHKSAAEQILAARVFRLGLVFGDYVHDLYVVRYAAVDVPIIVSFTYNGARLFLLRYDVDIYVKRLFKVMANLMQASPNSIFIPVSSELIQVALNPLYHNPVISMGLTLSDFVGKLVFDAIELKLFKPIDPKVNALRKPKTNLRIPPIPLTPLIIRSGR